MTASKETSASPFSEKAHFRHLDALRGLAVLSVVLVHATILSKQIGFIQDLGFNEQKGVQLFYIISAFTLCHSFAIRSGQERHPLGNYFIRRFFRIAPLFYLAILGNLLLNGLAPRHESPAGLTPFEIFLGFIFLNGIDPNAIDGVVMGGWSVAVEMMFYLVLPLMLCLVTNFRQSLVLLVISSILAPLLSYFCYHLFPPSDLLHDYFFYFWFPIEFPVFCLGICAYFYWRDYLRHRSGSQKWKFLSFGLLLAVPPLYLVNLVTVQDALYPICFSFALLLTALCLHEWLFFVNPVTIFLGKISYSIYLTHFFCLYAVDFFWRWLEQAHGIVVAGTFPGLILVFLSLLLATVPVSIFTYHFIERPGIQLGRALIQRRERTLVPARL